MVSDASHFVVLPGYLVDPFLALRQDTERYLSVLAQRALTEFMRTGEFGHHLRRMRQLYAERWLVFSNTVEKWLNPWLEVTPAECGLQTAAWLLPRVPDTKIAAAAAREGVEAQPISTFYAATEKARPGFLLGFGAVAPEELRAGARRFAQVLGQLKE